MRASELGDRSQTKPSLARNSLSPAELRYIDETVAAIRLRARHHDPYEEWERQTRRDAFMTARKEQHDFQLHIREELERIRREEGVRQAATHERQAAEIERKLRELALHQQKEQQRMKDFWDARAKQLHQRIESVIKVEEDKVKAQLEAERKVKEEEEKKRREAETKRRLDEEKKRQEEEQRRKEAEAIRKEEEQKKQKEEEEKQRASQEKLDDEQRKNEELAQRQALGVTTAQDDWQDARRALHQLKSSVMQPIKSDKPSKSAWSSIRRQITPKIGQITNDEQTINRIATQLYGILRPNPPHPQPIYLAALSSLSKAILLQAETEVTAEKRAAIPLSRVTRHLLGALPDFHHIFLAKLVQRVGGWAIPIVVPAKDHDGQPWADNTARARAMGYRKSGDGGALESNGDYATRISGILRVYFSILTVPVSPSDTPLPPMFQLPRFWTWFARLMGERALLVSHVAPQVIYAALDVFGAQARAIWGVQWIKMLGLLYEGVTNGIGDGKYIGGDTPEGKAARVRVQLEVERIAYYEQLIAPRPVS
ncbi:hypothetical protein ONZ45_g12055 [Pleurotus djamor]|nr:hypothetical protein ONZ45_g12055 [Pleurotus djamor]